MTAGRAAEGIDLPARLAHDLGRTKRTPLDRARNPARIPFRDLSGVLDKAKLESSASTLGAFGIIHGPSLTRWLTPAGRDESEIQAAVRAAR